VAVLRAPRGGAAVAGGGTPDGARGVRHGRPRTVVQPGRDSRP
jgi:hypothetical protein